MIERVADAIQHQMGSDDNMPEDLARAAILAMREPSAAMLDEDTVQVVVGCCGVRPEHAREVWGQMIDAALKPVGE